MHAQTLMGLTPEQSACSFSNDELYMLAFGNTPQANACRELLAYRQTQQVVHPVQTTRPQTAMA